MATKQEIDMLRGLLKQNIPQDRAKDIVLKFRTKQQGLDGGMSQAPKEENPGVLTMDKLKTMTGGVQSQGDEQTPPPPPVSSDGGGLQLPKGLQFLDNPVGKGITEGGKFLQKGGEQMTTEATGKEFPFKNIVKNIFPSLAKEAGSTLEVVGSPLDAGKNFLETGKAILQAGLGNNVILPDLPASESDKEIQAAISEGVQDFKKKIKESGQDLPKGLQTIGGTGIITNKMVQENPALLLTIMTSMFKKVGRFGGNVEKAAKAQEQAEILTQQFFKPTKDVTTRATEKVVPEFLERGIQGTRTEVLADAKKQLKDYGKQIEEIRKTEGITGTMEKQPLLDILDESAKRESLYLDELLQKDKADLTDIENQAIVGQEAKAKAYEKIRDQIDGFPDIVPLEKADTVKKAFDQLLNGTDKSLDAFQNRLRTDLANEIRSEISKANPSLAEVNKEFSFYKNIETILEETRKRESGKFEGGGIESKRSGILRSVGGFGGAAAGSLAGPSGAGLGGLLGILGAGKLDNILSSPKYKLVSAAKKKKLADALVRGDKQATEKILDSIILTQGLNLKTTEPMQSTQENKKVDFFN